MARVTKKLSPAKVSALIKAGVAGMWGDGAGLWLRITATRNAYWVFGYMKNGKAHEISLGPCHTVGLAEARERARRYRVELLDGLDPAAARLAAKAAAKPVITFGQVADLYFEAHAPAWKSAVHRQQWQQTLDQYVRPRIGDKAVAEIETGDVMGALEPIWQKMPETASRVRGRVENILDYAKARGWRQGENVARWRGHLENLLPHKGKLAPVVHHPALPYQEMPQFMPALRQRQGVAARAAGFCILTATRSSETRGARWSEIDRRNRTWTIPRERMKAAQEHRIPLSDAALAILDQMEALRETDDALIFPGGNPGAPLSDVVLGRAVRLSAPGKEVTLHGFRSSFRDWAGETTAYPREVIEMALAHRLGKAEQAYARGDLFQKRRRLMDDWSAFCATAAASYEPGEVVVLRA